MNARLRLGPFLQENVNHAPAPDDARPRERPMSVGARSQQAGAAIGASNLPRRPRPLRPPLGGGGRGEDEPISLLSKSQAAAQATARYACSCGLATVPLSLGPLGERAAVKSGVPADFTRSSRLPRLFGTFFLKTP